jgi:hypothetical protein
MGFRDCNDYRSRYARLVMQQEPDLAGLFTLRQLESALIHQDTARIATYSCLH